MAVLRSPGMDDIGAERTQEATHGEPVVRVEGGHSPTIRRARGRMWKVCFPRVSVMGEEGRLSSSTQWISYSSCSSSA